MQHENEVGFNGGNGAYRAVGGVVGYNAGVIDSVKVYGSIVVNRIYSNTVGVVGTNDVHNPSLGQYALKNCENNASVFSNGNVGGIMGNNFGNGSDLKNNGLIEIFICSVWRPKNNNPNKTEEVVENKAAGGVFGHNNSGFIIGCSNTATIKYANPDVDNSKDLRPRIGLIGGYNRGSYNIVNYSAGGSVNHGTLLNKSSNNQRQYANNNAFGENIAG